MKKCSFSRARATNTQLGQDENSEFVELEVYGEDGADVSPEILFPPKDTVVVKGSRLTELQCIANARPLLEMELVWLKDGKPLEEAEIGFSFNDLWNRTLSLFQADASYEGVYSCQVRMRTGGPTITREARVTVIGKSFALDSQKVYPPSPPFIHLFKKGHSLYLPCLLVKYPSQGFLLLRPW